MRRDGEREGQRDGLPSHGRSNGIRLKIARARECRDPPPPPPPPPPLPLLFISLEGHPSMSITWQYSCAKCLFMCSSNSSRALASACPLGITYIYTHIHAHIYTLHWQRWISPLPKGRAKIHIYIWKRALYAFVFLLGTLLRRVFSGFSNEIRTLTFFF